MSSTEKIGRGHEACSLARSEECPWLRSKKRDGQTLLFCPASKEAIPLWSHTQRTSTRVWLFWTSFSAFGADLTISAFGLPPSQCGHPLWMAPWCTPSGFIVSCWVGSSSVATAEGRRGRIEGGRERRARHQSTTTGGSKRSKFYLMVGGQLGTMAQGYLGVGFTGHFHIDILVSFSYLSSWFCDFLPQHSSWIC